VGPPVRPATGRLTQEDPIGLDGGLSIHGYAGGDPLNSWDPFGLSDCKKNDPPPKCLPVKRLESSEVTAKRREAEPLSPWAQQFTNPQALYEQSIVFAGTGADPWPRSMLVWGSHDSLIGCPATTAFSVTGEFTGQFGIVQADLNVTFGRGRRWNIPQVANMGGYVIRVEMLWPTVGVNWVGKTMVDCRDGSWVGGTVRSKR
jgi:hypothetical protein